MENSTKDLTEQLNDEFTRAVLPVTIIVGIEVVVGFFGNLLVIYVFLFHYRVCTFRYFVLCLAFIDITCCITTMPGEMVTQLYWYVYPVRELCKIKSFFNVFTVTAEALCLVTIAFDRYRKVCRPFSWQLKPRVAKGLCGIYCIVALFVALPTPFLWGLRSATKIYENVSINVTLCEKDQTFEKTDYPIGYVSTVAAVILILLILMFIQYVFVAMKLLKERRHRMGSGKTMVNNTPNMCSPTHSGNENPDTSQISNDNVAGCDNEVEREFSTNEDSDKPRDISEIKITDLHNNRNTREKRAFKRNVPKRINRPSVSHSRMGSSYEEFNALSEARTPRRRGANDSKSPTLTTRLGRPWKRDRTLCKALVTFHWNITEAAIRTVDPASQRDKSIISNQIRYVIWYQGGGYPVLSYGVSTSVNITVTLHYS
ncbi:uncharacterized protein LOC128559225 [Mercenaria mercenaria]|uniref:uncharacterized protein LOC128559225 n=1 Tax=Mercenaria mercenaria TaxID=6596 RepID=UPI00234FA731|nr:uncharacterized protein LOC128559225 [Mercenaria mercenaria]